MATTNLRSPEVIITDGKDGLVVVNNYTSKRGGTSLDVTGFAPLNIRAGHVIIKETATGNFKPMPVTGTGASTAYGTLPANHTYAGHAVNTVLTARAMVGVMYQGEINDLVIDAANGIYDLTSIKTALKAALPQMMYTGDNV